MQTFAFRHRWGGTMLSGDTSFLLNRHLALSWGTMLHKLQDNIMSKNENSYFPVVWFRFIDFQSTHNVFLGNFWFAVKGRNQSIIPLGNYKIVESFNVKQFF